MLVVQVTVSLEQYLINCMENLAIIWRFVVRHNLLYPRVHHRSTLIFKRGAIFLRICHRKSFESWLFAAKLPRNGPIFLRILTFFQRKSHEIGRFFHKFWLFSRENPAKLADFSANLPLKIPRNFAFFSAKYQKPWILDWHVRVQRKSVLQLAIRASWS